MIMRRRFCTRSLRKKRGGGFVERLIAKKEEGK
jgi:hypothetical protein